LASLRWVVTDSKISFIHTKSRWKQHYVSSMGLKMEHGQIVLNRFRVPSVKVALFFNLKTDFLNKNF
jgi:hypothetical protein